MNAGEVALKEIVDSLNAKLSQCGVVLCIEFSAV